MNKARTEAFSDGVFAIAITLLVLDIKLPAETATSDRDLRHLLQQALPNILTFIFSFLVVGVFWVAHHRIFESIKSMNHFLLWSNIFYLMTIAVIPFPAAVLAQHPFYNTSVIFYSSILFLCGLQHFFLLRYVYKHAELKATQFTPDFYKRALRTAAVGPACYLLAIASAFLSSVLSFCFIISALVFYIFLAPLLFENKNRN
jgi:uncharacterized membrane protein